MSLNSEWAVDRGTESGRPYRRHGRKDRRWRPEIEWKGHIMNAGECKIERMTERNAAPSARSQGSTLRRDGQHQLTLQEIRAKPKLKEALSHLSQLSKEIARNCGEEFPALHLPTGLPANLTGSSKRKACAALVFATPRQLSRILRKLLKAQQ
jgi:hypothetical protein